LAWAGLTDLDWVLAEVVAARRTRTGLVVGELGWRSRRVRFACVNRSLHYRLAQQGASWQPGLSATFALRLVLHPRFGFQAEVHDIDVASIRKAMGGES
jgi:hypothetical protein